MTVVSPPASPPSATGWAARRLSSTPARLQAISWGLVAAIALSTVFGVIGVLRRHGNLGAVRTAASTLGTVQAIRVAVVRADSLASESYLLGGLERPESRQAFLDEVGTATKDLVEVGRQVPAAAAVLLATANTELNTYVGLVEQARTNNRQGFPVGAAYQRQAHQRLATQLLPALGATEQLLRDTVNAKLSGAADNPLWWLVPLIGTLALAIIANQWLARRFRRALNVPLLAAAALLLVVLIAVTVLSGSRYDSARSAVAGSLSTADLTAQIRADLYDARANEALTLVFRGNGAAQEADWQASMAKAEATVAAVCKLEAAACDASTAIDTYTAAHQQMRALDDGGDWDGAVKATLGQGGTVDVASAFSALATQTEQRLSAIDGVAEGALDDATGGRGLMLVLVVGGGLVAALVVSRGFSQRLREYR